MERLEVMDAIYKNGWEDGRLSSSRHGQLEYYMTMQYIHNYIPAGKRVLEVGAVLPLLRKDMKLLPWNW